MASYVTRRKKKPFEFPVWVHLSIALALTAGFCSLLWQHEAQVMSGAQMQQECRNPLTLSDMSNRQYLCFLVPGSVLVTEDQQVQHAEFHDGAGQVRYLVLADPHVNMYGGTSQPAIATVWRGTIVTMVSLGATLYTQDNDGHYAATTGRWYVFIGALAALQILASVAAAIKKRIEVGRWSLK